MLTLLIILFLQLQGITAYDVLIKGREEHFCVDGTKSSLISYASLSNVDGVGVGSEALSLPQETTAIGIAIYDNNVINGYPAPGFRLVDNGIGLSSDNKDDWTCIRQSTEPSGSWCSYDFAPDSDWYSPIVLTDWEAPDKSFTTDLTTFGGEGTIWCRWKAPHTTTVTTTTVTTTTTTTTAPATCDTTNPCSPHATCESTAGGYTCICKSGFSGNGYTCTDFDECTQVANSCSPLATCENTPGSYTCTCQPGYTGDGQSCTDVNECDSFPCGSNSICENTPGSYRCTCDTGYQWDGTYCRLISTKPVECDGEWVGPTPVRGDMLCMGKQVSKTWIQAKASCEAMGATLPRLPTQSDARNWTYRRTTPFSEGDIAKEIAFYRELAMEKATVGTIGADPGYPLDYEDESRSAALGNSVLKAFRSASLQVQPTGSRKAKFDPLGAFLNVVKSPFYAVRDILTSGLQGKRPKRQAQLNGLLNSAKDVNPVQGFSGPQDLLDPTKLFGAALRLFTAPQKLVHGIKEDGDKEAWKNSDGGVLRTVQAQESFSDPTQPADLFLFDEDCLFLWPGIELGGNEEWKIHDGFCDGLWIHDWPTLCRFTMDQYCTTDRDDLKLHLSNCA